MSDSRPRLLWLCGPSGVGKSATGFEIFSLLARAGVRAAYLDSDQVSLFHLAPAGGPHVLRARGLGALWPNVVAAGARCLVFSGYVNSPDEVRLYTDAVPGADVTVVRLRADPEVLRRRYLGRGWLPDLAEAALADALALDRTEFADTCLDTSGLTVSEAARRVLDRAGALPGARPGGPLMPTPTPATPPEPAPVLWVGGPTGVGKSTVAYAVHRQYARAGVPVAYVDLQQIGFLRPAADGDAIAIANLAALWRVHRDAGARGLIVSGDLVPGHADVFATTSLTGCRLHASPDTLAERLLLRGRGLGPPIPGDELRGLPPATLRRIAARAAREEPPRDGVPRVHTDGLSVEETARQVRLLAGDWPATPRDRDPGSPGPD